MLVKPRHSKPQTWSNLLCLPFPDTDILETCKRKPSQNCPKDLWLPFLILYSPFLMLLPKKRLMLPLRVSYQDWSPRRPSASHLRRSLWPRTAQVSQESLLLRGPVNVGGPQSQSFTHSRWSWAYFAAQLIPRRRNVLYCYSPSF